MDTQNLIEVLAREVLKEIAKRENEKLSENNEIISKKSVLTVFLGNDEVLKDELKKETSFMENIKLDSTWEEIGQCENKKILVVAHAGVIQSLISYYLFNNLDGYWQFKLDNGSITKMTVMNDEFVYFNYINK